MKFDIITLFPEAINFNYSILARSITNKKIEVNVHDLRKFGAGSRLKVDDTPFGGGPGMVLQIEPIYKVLKEIGAFPLTENTAVVLTSARGDQWKQSTAVHYQKTYERIVIICGHYEGVDARVADHLVTAEVSIGPYILTGGELPAQIIIDSIARLVTGVLGNPDSLTEESYQSENDSDVEYPQYTKPAIFTTDEGDSWEVPSILTSGHHKEIEKWRKAQSLKQQG